MKQVWKWIADGLDRVPAALGIPALIVVAVLVWLGAFKLLGL